MASVRWSRVSSRNSLTIIAFIRRTYRAAQCSNTAGRARPCTRFDGHDLEGSSTRLRRPLTLGAQLVQHRGAPVSDIGAVPPTTKGKRTASGELAGVAPTPAAAPPA